MMPLTCALKMLKWSILCCVYFTTGRKKERKKTPSEFHSYEVLRGGKFIKIRGTLCLPGVERRENEVLVHNWDIVSFLM